MALYLENANTSESIRLWNAQEYNDNITVPENIYSPVATDAEETILSVLQQTGSITIDGIVLGPQRIREGATSQTDPILAAAEWVLELEAWVNGSPGTEAFQLRNSATGETINCVPSASTWTRGVGETTSSTYGLELTLGGGLDSGLGINPTPPTARSTDTFDGITLPNIFERSVDKQIELNSFEQLLTADAEQNEQVIQGAPVKRTTLLGEFVGSFSEQRTFDQKLRDRSGDGNTYTYASAYPGETIEAALVGVESTREAGVTELGEYIVELVAGQAV